MKILKEKDVSPIIMRPGDSLSVSWQDETIETFKVETYQTINRVVIFEIQDQYGFKTGIGAIVGEKQ